LCAACAVTGTALAFGPVGKDPAHNFKVGRLPLACDTSVTSKACVNGVVYWLDQARAKLHQGPYKLPADFASLTAAKQAFILVNLDRLQYHLPVMQGLSRQLNSWALAGVKGDRDPVSGNPHFIALGDWAGGYPNMADAYANWVYNDGYGSGNLDCTSPSAQGCWGHRHAVLWGFGSGGKLAMGAAASVDRRGTPGYTMLIGKAESGYKPTFYYTWAQAKAAGAGTHNYVVHRPAAVDLVLEAHGLDLVALIAAPGQAKCQVSQRSGGGWSRSPFGPCASGQYTLHEISGGRYRFRLKANGKTLTRYITLHRHQ
jgi:hypothetical protein